MLDIRWLFVRLPKSDAALLPHDVLDLYTSRDRPRDPPVFESREGMLNHVREIDESLALAVRLEDE